MYKNVSTLIFWWPCTIYIGHVGKAQLWSAPGLGRTSCDPLRLWEDRQSCEELPQGCFSYLSFYLVGGFLSCRRLTQGRLSPYSLVPVRHRTFYLLPLGYRCRLWNSLAAVYSELFSNRVPTGTFSLILSCGAMEYRELTPCWSYLCCLCK